MSARPMEATPPSTVLVHSLVKLIPFAVSALSMAMLVLMYWRFQVLSSSLSTVPIAFVRLNVGGATFQTTTATLLRRFDSIFPVVLSAPNWPRDESGAYLFDWGPEDIPFVLQYLRTGRLEAGAPCGDGTVASSHHLRRTFAFFRLSLPPVSLAFQHAMNSDVQVASVFLRERVFWDVDRSDLSIVFGDDAQVATLVPTDLIDNGTSPLLPPTLVGVDAVNEFAVWTSDVYRIGLGIAPRHCFWSLIEDCMWHHDGLSNDDDDRVATPGILQLRWEGNTRHVVISRATCDDLDKCNVEFQKVATVQTYLGRNADVYPDIRLFPGNDTLTVTVINPLEAY
ncbi:hypothetical protein SPRG_11186 [Saprolegnia parasitica CBS 223.65]|uniref:Potassium channel tetramerisation-type BTB domain-containing protein n=1 Tax=Saprolegnia parasitica (strain CBS 223.65) TaxID=695850 RepID=A0A067C9Q1_SAPPC|nr:hypothetical protein SPRG_11186 [Saprolegnia parasitica CBS 223.65]KDO23256.1 hypothetical protein SPRG_11186 [Saprolegnia parasitica CBS 223.65]|eukprot:XP_012206044.1 hypothetical protein SPRG_11186 [Saprolegnia parasitica CBS 223.65]